MRRRSSALLAGLLALFLIPGMAAAAPRGNTQGTFSCIDGTTFVLNFGDVKANNGSEGFIVGTQYRFIAKSVRIIQPDGGLWFGYDRGIKGFDVATLLTCSSTPDQWDAGWSITLVGWLTPRSS